MKNIMRLSFLFSGYVLVMCSSCKPSMSSQQFNAEEDKFFATYSTGNVHQAETALLDGLNWVSKHEGEYRIPGTDFAAHKAMFHERLFLIYQATHDTNKMESELRQSIECVNQSNVSQGLPALTNSESDFATKLHNLDSGKSIRWQTNDFW